MQLGRLKEDAIRLDERTIIEQAKRGSVSAYEDLVCAHGQIAFRIAFLILGDSSRAQDAAQEGFVKAYRALDRFDSIRHFRPWLLRIVTNEALNAAKANQRRNEAERRYIEDRVAVSNISPSPDEIVIDREARTMLLDAVSKLRTADQIVIYMRYVLGLTETEMAEALGCKIGTVRSPVVA